MPANWEFRLTRTGEQIRGSKKRTVGRYEVFHNGARVPGMEGATAESPGPGANAPAGNGRCVEAGTYNVFTQFGAKYRTIGYTSSVNPTSLKRPALLLLPTGQRVGILIHPARNFLWSIGCINLATVLPNASSDMDFVDSRTRVIAVIDDLAAFVGGAFPTATVDSPVPGARVVIH